MMHDSNASTNVETLHLKSITPHTLAARCASCSIRRSACLRENARTGGRKGKSTGSGGPLQLKEEWKCARRSGNNAGLSERALRPLQLCSQQRYDMHEHSSTESTDRHASYALAVSCSCKHVQHPCRLAYVGYAAVGGCCGTAVCSSSRQTRVR